MKIKRFLAGLLAAALVCGLMVVVPASAATGGTSTSGFTDITDPAVAEAAEVLRLLGVVNGTGGTSFNPGGTLTRAEFCKMAIEIMGKGEEASAQMNRTIFLDVKGDHWARGYINLAASTRLGATEEGGGGEMLMVGVGDGTFRPNQTITFAEAVTIMMRILGYTASDVASGSSWYSGYLSSAAVIGLTDGVSLTWNSTITRGQTAILFENMLYTNPKGAETPYLTQLGGSITDEAVIISLDATAADGTASCILTTGSADPYKTNHVPFDSTLAGARAKLVLDKNSKVIAIMPSEGGTQRTTSVVSAEINSVTVSGGEKLDVPPTTTVYRESGETTYKDIYLNLKTGSPLVLHYGVTGKLEYLYLPYNLAAEEAAVAKGTVSGNPFASLVGNDTGYQIVKNGLPATLSDIRQYDVATYDKASKTLYVSDLRLTGVYENVSPSPATPLTVTMMGATFPVLSSAYTDLSSFKIGDVITLLLTSDGQVAGAVSPSVAKSTTVGVVEMKGTNATVTPLSDIRDADGKKVVFSGATAYSEESAAQMQGQLVTVSSTKLGMLSLSRLSGSGASGALDMSTRTLGSDKLADNVVLYERVGKGAPVEISFDQLTRTTVPANKITYVGKDYADRVNFIVFDDVTGDQYTYGFAKKGTVTGGSSSMSYSNTCVSVEIGNDTYSDQLITGAAITENMPIGITASLDEIDGFHKLSNWVTLKAVENVPRSAFELNEYINPESKAPIGTVTTRDMVLPVAGNVLCYNKTTKSWFASLDEARAYSDTLTIYYDRAPQEGGKVRLVVVG
ncbi:MAG: S-layer homology domain-containing protein [Pseudoflavonifractor capillosus]|uniref:S-layer homology domain-containing protein n=1 Tax=Pseudoflavonifractor capillosus TaxID=106588 RepID=UPI0023F8AE60|nr:S-layer homology domain-containing protein [Pseudoflavonifractor capillosus]MCI5928137.1 S-layer homology domain-containing protein [Pseudoflavonifractor capillosus]